MGTVRYYHVTESLSTGQIIIQGKYATLTDEEAFDGGTEMHERFKAEYGNTTDDDMLHWLMSEGALKELREEITKVLRTT